MGRWSKLDKEEFHNLHSSPNIIWLINSRRMRWGDHVSRSEGDLKCIQNFSRKTWRARLGRRWEIILKWTLKEQGTRDVNWIRVTQDRVNARTLVNTIMNLQLISSLA
jgi:hypothetical protein